MGGVLGESATIEFNVCALLLAFATISAAGKSNAPLLLHTPGTKNYLLPVVSW
jgi:hypothetical protein